MKTRTSKDGLRRVWYDRSIRLYVMQHLDGDGNQTEGEVEYTSDKVVAAKHLVPSSWSGPSTACCDACGAEINAGRMLSSIRTEARAASARANGAKGGRPRGKRNGGKKAPRRLLVTFSEREGVKAPSDVRIDHIETVETL
jgi:hypothetical protein